MNMKYLKYPLLVIGSLIVIFVLHYVSNLHVGLNRVEVMSGNDRYTYFVEYADTEEERARGLMWRDTLNDDEGMLFLYNEETKPSFWMKNTLIPLDMVFIGSDLIIKHIAHEAEPCKATEKKCAFYKPDEAVQYVLEINGGQSELKGFKEGDSVSFVK